MTKNREESPQSKLSKSLYVHALLKLIEEKPYKQINITELSKKADMSRRTFYRHFTIIDEVLDYALDQIYEQFIIYRSNQNATSLESTIYVYFSYWRKRKNFLLTLKRNDLLFKLQNKFVPKPQHNQRDEFSNVEKDVTDYAIWFTSGAIWSLLMKWLEDDTKYSPEDMATIVEKIIIHLYEKK